MKDEYNDLLRERIAIEKKHAVTSQYSRLIRNYHNLQANKRAAEKSRQKWNNVEIGICWNDTLSDERK